MKCQAFPDQPVQLCTNPVSKWWSCGNGCGENIAYCDEHGGTPRAQLEMAKHMVVHWPWEKVEPEAEPEDRFCAKHGRASRPITIEGLRCDCTIEKEKENDERK